MKVQRHTLFFAVITLGCPSLLLADPGDCPSNPAPNYVLNNPERYQVYDGRWDLIGLTPQQGRLAASYGAEAWNSETVVANFVDNGFTSSSSSLPDDYISCWWYGINRSKIRVVDRCKSWAAYANERCCDAWDCNKFEIEIASKTSKCKSRSYINAWDLADLLAHEFGHTLNVQHPNNGEYAVMCSDSNCQGTANPRLREYDIRCATSNAVADDFIRHAYYLLQYPDGTFYPVPQVAKQYTYRIAGDYNAATSGPNEAYLDFLGMIWYPGSNSNDALYMPIDHRTSVLGAIHYVESPSEDRIEYIDHHDNGGMTSSDSNHVVKYMRSTNQFQTYVTGTQSYCTNMTSWMSCPYLQRSPIETGRRLAHAELNALGIYPVTVTAWIDQDEGGTGKNRIMISVGRVDSNAVAEPVSYLGFTSTVSPGIACLYDSAPGGYDCIIAYVPANPTLSAYEGAVHIKTFRVGMGLYSFTVTMGPTVYRVLPNSYTTTVSDVEAWYTAGKWWIAIRDSFSSGGYLNVMSSVNLSTWSQQVFTPIIGAPSISQNTNGYNYLYYLQK